MIRRAHRRRDQPGQRHPDVPRQRPGRGLGTRHDRDGDAALLHGRPGRSVAVVPPALQRVLAADRTRRIMRSRRSSAGRRGAVVTSCWSRRTSTRCTKRAGSTRIVKVHGSADRCRCADPACRLGAVESIALDEVDFSEFERDRGVAAIPSCPGVRQPVRPHVLWFDELYVSHADYHWHVVDAGRVTHAAADLHRHVAGRRRDLVPAVGGSRRRRRRCSSSIPASVRATPTVDGARAGQGRRAPAATLQRFARPPAGRVPTIEQPSITGP